jgi:hypothetical protein
MNYDYFASQEGLTKLLNDYNEVFTLLDDISQQLLQGIVTTTDDFRTVLNQATGAYGTIEPLYSLAIAYKENAELRYYVEKKRELEGKGEKVVAASLDKESSDAVADIRRVRNILEGYSNVAEKLIITAQTQLKRIDNDGKYKPQEEA